MLILLFKWKIWILLPLLSRVQYGEFYITKATHTEVYWHWKIIHKQNHYAVVRKHKSFYGAIFDAVDAVCVHTAHIVPSFQGSETAADTAESIHTKRRIKKLQSLVQAKKGHQSGAGKGKNTSENNGELVVFFNLLEKLHCCVIIKNNFSSSSDHLADVLSNNNPVLTCIGLGRKTQRSPKTVPSPQQQQAKDHEYSEEEGLWSHGVGNHPWSPFECSQPWAPFYHTCHQPRHDLWVCGGTLSLPRTTEWDRFESLIQELDNKQSNLARPQMIRSITDLHLSQNMVRYTWVLLTSINWDQINR